jgi:DNA-binding CsgD family transcriptional regulator/pimeloyl-ACP methyl ester carboxylesterase
MDAPPVQYVTTSDGYSVAYTVTGYGRSVVMLHVPRYYMERLWGGQRSAPWMEGLSGRFHLIQCEFRTQGVSARDVLLDLSIADLADDLDAVLNHLNLGSVVLLGWMGFAHVALRYAVANPGRVEALVLACSGVAGDVASQAMFEALPDQDWDMFLQAQLPPGLSLDERNRELELLRKSSSQGRSIAGMHAARVSNVREILPLVDIPTLVLHPRDYVMWRSEESAKLAAGIKDAGMVLIDGDDMLGDHVQGLKAIDDFLAGVPHHSAPAPGEASQSSKDGLSPRELEVLRLVAAGRSNAQIADELVISASTVAKHVSSIFAKTGAANRVEAASYARDHGLV